MEPSPMTPVPKAQRRSLLSCPTTAPRRLFRTTTTDQNGAFALRGRSGSCKLTPGPVDGRLTGHSSLKKYEESPAVKVERSGKTNSAVKLRNNQRTVSRRAAMFAARAARFETIHAADILRNVFSKAFGLAEIHASSQSHFTVLHGHFDIRRVDEMVPRQLFIHVFEDAVIRPFVVFGSDPGILSRCVKRVVRIRTGHPASPPAGAPPLVK